MDAAEPPRVLFESTADCADRDRAEALARQALEPARAPGTGWVVMIRISAATPPGVTAEAEITDASGGSRSHQQMTGDAANCAALGAALGAWAGGALRTQRLEDTPAVPEPPAPAPTTPPPDATVGLPAPPPTPSRSAKPLGLSGSLASFANSAPEPTSAEASSEYEMPEIELGTGAFLMVGGAAGGYAGVSPFLVDEIAEAVYLRPSVAVGQALSVNLRSTWAGGRLDTCTRLPGHYASNGIQLDLCGGPDVGFSYVASGTQPGMPREGRLLPYVALGPSVDLRAEVGRLAVSLRIVSEFNVAHRGFVDVAGNDVEDSGWTWRFELAFSGALRHSRP